MIVDVTTNEVVKVLGWGSRSERLVLVEYPCQWVMSVPVTDLVGPGGTFGLLRAICRAHRTPMAAL